MKYLLYSSKATFPENSEINNRIPEKSQHRNAKRGLTGFLHREKDFFVQYLEGPDEELDNLMHFIRRDRLHTDVVIHDQGALSAPMMPDWKMAFVDNTRVSMSDFFWVDHGRLDFSRLDPFEIVSFLLQHADALREDALVA